MIRLFIYLAIVVALGFGFSWIADNPGNVTLNWQGFDVQTSLMVVVVAMVALIAVILFTWAMVRGIIGLPSVLSHYFTNRRRSRGYHSLSKGLIAAGTGDKALARRLAKESGKLLNDEPLVELLDAQTLLLEGNREQARIRFEAMLENEETKLLGLRGLYLEAEREGAREASRQYADEAAALAPTLAWAGNAKLRNLSLDGDWEGALKTLESNRSAGLIDKDNAKRHRAVLLTARAMAEEPANPDLAIKLANEAHRLAPGLVATAVTGAAAYMRANNLRKASRLIEDVWKISPHPELAQSYVHLRIADSATDRLKRAQTLVKLAPKNHESSIALAQAAIDAKDWQIARQAMADVLVNSPSERACLIMADIEEGEHGDAGRMRDWLSRAVRAPRDAKWTADGYTSDKWLPISPLTGEIDVFEWKVPVEQLQQSSEMIDVDDIADLGKLLEPLEVVEEAQVIEIVAEDEKPDDEPKAANKPKQKATPAPGKKQSAKAATKEVLEPTETVFPLERRPDDPGVEEETV